MEKKEVDFNRQRATDMKGNTHVVLPPALIPKVEGELAVRKYEFKKIFTKLEFQGATRPSF